MHLPDLDSLRCFEAAAVLLSFRAAAEQVALSPPAFSERIRRLEDELGARLFDRTRRSVVLTEAGRRLLPQAREALEAARRCRDVVRAEGRAPYALTVGTRHELGMSWLLPALQALRPRHPERTVHLSFGGGAELLAAVERGTLEAAVTSSRIFRPGLTWATLHPERYAFVGAPELLAELPLDGPADAAGHLLLDIDRTLPLFRYLLDALGQAEAWSFRGTWLLGTIAAVRAQVLAGAGVAVLPRYFVASDLEAGRLLPLLPQVEPVEDAFRLVWRSGDPREDDFRLLAEELREFALR